MNSRFFRAVLVVSFLIVLTSVLGACAKQGTPSEINKMINSEADAFSQEEVLLSLVDFNTEAQQNWLVALDEAKFTRVNKNNDHVLALQLPSQGHISTLRIQPESPWQLDVFDHYNLAFELENHSDESLQLYLSVENPEGKIQSRSISVARGFAGTIYFPLTGPEAETEVGLWGDLPPWKTADKLMIWRSWRADQVKLNKIAALNFFTIGTINDKSLVIDDIRIRKNPPTDINWLAGFVDQYGQNAKQDTPLTVHSDDELRQYAADELAELAQSSGMAHRSQYGGYTNGPKLKATGYFRTEKVDGKWWMVDPDGHLFFSHGPANVRMANLTTLTGVDFKDSSVRIVHADETTPEDSMGIIHVSDEVRKTRYILSDVRNSMFTWLPNYDEPLAEHYSYRRSTHKGAVPHGETYSFYRANLQRRYGETEPKSYIKKWHEVTLDRMRDWGFTSFGNWVDPAFYEAERVPYFANGWIIGDFKMLSGESNHWGLMPDPYDPLFAERAKATIDEIAKSVKSSPWCAGIFIDNEKSWGEREGSVVARYGVIVDALSKSTTESPAKAAFSTYLKTKYSTIEALNSAWQTHIESWLVLDAGLTFEHYSDAHVADLSSMLEMLGEQYFIVVHNALEKALPNHLYMGARMANWGMPDEIIKASLKYSDVLSFNIYEEGMQEQFWSFLEEVDLPVVIGEFHIGTATDSGLLNPGIVHAANQTDRARMYKAYMKSILEKDYMVGAHWFQYVDEPISGRAFDGENANIGFVTVTDIPYPELIAAVKEVTSTMYQERYGK